MSKISNGVTNIAVATVFCVYVAMTNPSKILGGIFLIPPTGEDEFYEGAFKITGY
ncbi:hypothetical protein [Lysinibacillus sphaericus]|uniref:hypothetical protein n=1 Tax=Lysinibacillus sphaericus TaxID=1421 RepID=UPI0019D4EFD5|nr:hypothetical protein [Lysinibacillus sphaericus]